jgi:hypothetical protein
MNLEANRQFWLGHPCCSKAPNLTHVCFSLFSVPVRLSTGNSTFLNTIRPVFLMGAKPEVPRINTSCLISTWTVVANTHPIRNGAKVDQPTDAMSPNILFPNANLPIPPIGSMANPQPTLTRFSLLHPSPKALLDFGRNLRQMAASLIRSHTAVWVRTRRSFARLLRPFFLSFSAFSVNH